MKASLQEGVFLQFWVNHFVSPYLSELRLSHRMQNISIHLYILFVSEIYGPENQTPFVSVMDVSCFSLFVCFFDGLPLSLKNLQIL